MQKKSKKVLSACSIASLLVTTTAVSTGVKAADSGVNRVGGANRYATAAKVAQSGWSSSDYAIVANGEGYADALCATPLAKANNAPVLLTTGDSSNTLEQNTLDELERLKVKHVIVIGGAGVVPDSVLNSIKGKVTDVERIGGQDRYETSAKIAEKLGTPTKAVIASGEGYADALSAGPAAAINGMPILLSRAGSLPDTISNYLKAHSQITQTYVIGGTASIGDSILNSLPSAKRLGGQTRFDTNVAVLREFASSFNFSNIYAALGEGSLGNEFADALTGGALAAKLRNPLVITGKTISSATSSFLKEKGFTNSTLTVLGGTANIPDSVASDIKGDMGSSSTPNNGGSSGGSSSSSGTNVTFDRVKSNTNYTDVVSRLNGGNLTNKYFTIVDDKDNAINVELKQNYTTAKEIFDKAQAKYNETKNINTDQIAKDVEEFNKKLTSAYSSLNGNNGIKANDKNLQDIIKNSGSKYINPADGTLEASAIVDEINKKAGTYTGDEDAFKDFKADLTNKVTTYFKNHPSKNSETVTVTAAGYEINRVQKGSDQLYSANSTPEKAAQDLIDFVLPSTNATGNYYIYLNNGDYILVNVALQSSSQV
ncbi:N-acetylmuramoyl-L-alanine amidase LytC precursor [Clostridium ragsdalei P11]|uniref:N-acetylmuramoyl-L-alanine amidase LytC n=1 Tax=Clostridium ragsdalei P11 TaxID=1353534 RepID=A0A1A6AIL3_9CLOT|nr:cell wall-binding repeat-containing protein [Clostridium ragsdalei]OBR89873.1 N-acetylmuramoyl-L-alanine amidase LytC precursor [Clostridium ragsdalei P11]